MADTHHIMPSTNYTDYELIPELAETGLPISNNVRLYSREVQLWLVEYLNELNDLERSGYNVAFHHLGDTFNIVKSNGFQKWLKQHSRKI